MRTKSTCLIIHTHSPVVEIMLVIMMGTDFLINSYCLGLFLRNTKRGILAFHITERHGNPRNQFVIFGRLVVRTEGDRTPVTPHYCGPQSRLQTIIMSLSSSLLLLLLTTALAAAQYQCNPDAAGLRQEFSDTFDLIIKFPCGLQADLLIKRGKDKSNAIKL